ncbi:MAG: hypothetical protein LIO62_06180, partial [Clostridiales bacterium]|nr:hypothetical protein [Clostridiales bacterium]
MTKGKRNCIDKLNTLFFGKDLRVTDGQPYTEVREYDFSSYYPQDDYVKIQEIPAQNVFDIRSYGASTANGDNAVFIQRAVDEASKSAGIVLVDGGDYISTTVVLKSNVTLFISFGSAISANESGNGYSEHKSILYAENAENITLTGGGKLKGNGHLFGRKPVMEKNNTNQADYIDVIEMRKNYRSQLRFAHPSKYGGPVCFKNCSNIKAENFIIENSAYWTFKLVNCNRVFINDFIINNNRNVANADGID